MTAQHFQRPLARLKHVGSWGQGRFRQMALGAGFDEGLLMDEAGMISEGTITNVGLWRDGTVIWPDAPSWTVSRCWSCGASSSQRHPPSRSGGPGAGPRRLRRHDPV